MNEGYVHCQRQNNISTIEFFHPLSNSMPGYLLKELSNAIRQESDKTSAIIVLKSAGAKAFCAGASFNELTAIKSEEEGLVFFSGFAEVINAMRNCKKFIIARVHGKCVGGGVGIAAAADYVLATTHAEIKLSELALGIGPFVIGPAVERKIGVSAFSELAIDAASWRSANWAGQKGLFNEVYEDVAKLDDAVQHLAQRLAQYHPEAMASLKNVFWQGTDHWETFLQERAALSGKLVMSSYTKEAIENFKKK